MDGGGPGKSTEDLTWSNVGLAFSFILFDAVISKTFALGVGTSLVTAAVRCVVQLTVVAMILQKVFETNNPWAVAGIACEHPSKHAPCVLADSATHAQRPAQPHGDDGDWYDPYFPAEMLSLTRRSCE